MTIQKFAVVLDNFTTAESIIKKYKQFPNILFELRLDLDPGLISLLELSEEFIVTIRSNDEGGKSKLPLDERHQQLLNIARQQPTYIDLEFARDLPILQEILLLTTGKVILSMHDYSADMKSTSKNYATALQNIETSDRIIVKFVGKPFDALDTLQGIANLQNFPQHVILGINTAGEISRTLSSYFKQDFVFGSLSKNFLLHIDDLLSLRENSIVTGLIGKTLQHSLSPQIHQLFREYAGIGGFYHLFEFTEEKRLLEFLQDAKNLPIQGFNVTFPYKQVVMQIADKITDNVALLQAANTLTINNSKILATNTDVSGFQKVLQELHTAVDSAVILGAGGAARAIALALLQKNIDTTIVYRNITRLKEFNDELRQQLEFIHISEKKLTADLFVNATPLGLKGELVTDTYPLPRGTTTIIDAVYGINGTPLTSNCQVAQCIDGKSMLFHQAVDAFEIWTNKRINREIVWEKLLQRLK